MKIKPKNLIYDVINLQIPMREECLREVESSLSFIPPNLVIKALYM